MVVGDSLPIRSSIAYCCVLLRFAFDSDKVDVDGDGSCGMVSVVDAMWDSFAVGDVCLNSAFDMLKMSSI